MTDNFTLDWASMAISLFNTILLLWLGLTVFLNAERRTPRQALRQHPRAKQRGRGRHWGIWLTSGGLMLGGAFFISHSAILGHGLGLITSTTDLWWRLGWIPVAVSPFAWYVVVLWYAGFWGDWDTPLHRRHRPGLLITTLLAAGSLGLLLLANPLPSFTQVARLDLTAAPSLRGVPLLILIYPLYMVFCIGLSLDVLLRPGPSGRVMGDLARRRARPWLLLASAALLVVSLLVAWVMAWMVGRARQYTLYGLYTNMATTVAWFDIVIAGLIGLAVLALGQAVVSYEVFTGKTLPRRGLWRYWRNAVILAAGYGVVIGWALTYRLRDVYGLLLSALLIAFFYALLSWRSYVERERYIEHLRPFVSSQRLYEQLLTASTSAPLEIDATTSFRVLCDEILGARLAYLVALGPLAPLVGPPLVYPGGDSAPPLTLPDGWLARQVGSPETMCLPLDRGQSAQAGGARWAVLLWSERGLIGVLLLGDKRDGGLYTQEEIEIARASGERLIDTQASAELARRLMALQRQRLAESQVLDRRARRALHDEVLPRLHTAMLDLSGGGDTAEALATLAKVHRQISDLLHEMPASTAPQVARLGLVGALRRAVDEELAGAFDRVVWQVEPEAERQAREIPSLTAEVLFYAAREAVRNAACHGRDADSGGPLHLAVAVAWRDGLEIRVEDDGVGLGAAGPAESGRGLALHSTMMAVVGGALAVESAPGAYTRVLLSLPSNSGLS